MTSFKNTRAATLVVAAACRVAAVNGGSTCGHAVDPWDQGFRVKIR